MALNTTFVAGTTVVTAAHMNGIQSAWATFTHGWTGTIGNGTIVAKYQQIGKNIRWRIQLTWGSTTSHPASNQTFNLPVAAHADYGTIMHMGNGIAYDVSALAAKSVYLYVNSSTTVIPNIVATDGAVTNAAPFTWATGDKLSFHGFYEAA